MLDAIALLLSLAAIFCFVNERYLHLEMTIGLMLLALVFSLVITILNYCCLDLHNLKILSLIEHIDFSQVVLQGVLCFLLFAGAKNVSLKNLKKHKWDVIILSVFATLVATLVIGSCIYLLFTLIGIKISYLYALMFGAIISPTDPIAALSILKSIGLPQDLEVVIDGESQFNDGIGVVIFVTLTSIIMGESTPQLSSISLLFIKQVLGGIGVGLVIALISHHLLTHSKNTTTQVLITLSAVSAGYAVAELINVSGPIASVVLGLIVGNLSIPKIESKKSKEHINIFWDMINQVLNAVLFVLIGLVALQVSVVDVSGLSSIIIAIVVVLLGRFISVYLSIFVLGLEHKFKLNSLLKFSTLFTWTGLRGALAIALVFSVANNEIKNLLIPMVYGVVVFSILIQGSTINLFFSPKMLKQLVKDKK